MESTNGFAGVFFEQLDVRFKEILENQKGLELRIGEIVNHRFGIIEEQHTRFNNKLSAMDKKIDDLTNTVQERQKAFAVLEDEQCQLWNVVFDLRMNNQPQNAILTLQQQISGIQEVETLRQLIKNYRKIAKDINIQMQGVPALVVLIQNNVNGFRGDSDFLDYSVNSKESIALATETLRKLDICVSDALNKLIHCLSYFKELNPAEMQMDECKRVYLGMMIEIRDQILAKSIPYKVLKECFAGFNPSLIFDISRVQNCKTKAIEHLEEANISLNAIAQKLNAVIQSMST